MHGAIEKSLFQQSISEPINPVECLSIECAQDIFDYFKNCSVFRWSDANNDCEDRANAICMLLDCWNIPNFKGWVFSGYFLKKDMGSLINFWNYHVASLLPVQVDDRINFYIIDPATSPCLITIEEWAASITQTCYSYYTITSGDTYIFSSRKIKDDNWYKRNKRNYRWTMQGLSGINGVSVVGKAHLRFNKHRVRKTEEIFKKLAKDPPSFLSSAIN